jgi:hypothetical protein
MKKKMWLVGGVGIVVLLAVAGLTLRGRGLGMAALHHGRAFLDHKNAVRGGNFTNVIFLHHSTGRALIQEGGVRERLTAAGFQFWDHDYNWEGLSRPDGTLAGYSYSIPGDNTDPDGLARLFAQRVYAWPLNAFSGLLQHEVIIFKSCFPVSNIESDEQLAEDKGYYRQIRAVIDKHPEHFFILLTQPPLNPAETTPEAAARARALADWLASPEFLAGHPNLAVFNFFDLLAESDPQAPDYNMLRAAYRHGTDSHPNTAANETIGPQLADFVAQTVAAYRTQVQSGGP